VDILKILQKGGKGNRINVHIVQLYKGRKSGKKEVKIKGEIFWNLFSSISPLLDKLECTKVK
jgi:hypothetical protein